jgi:dephospho-CoA kinase
MPHFLIGLTGGIGTGKSTVADELRQLGAEVVSGDELGRQVLEATPELQTAIRQKFGESVFTSEGLIDRRALGKRVFADPAEVQWLTQATFPGIYERWQTAFRRSARSVAVFDAALIFEWGIEKDFDLLLVVTAPLSDVQKRLSLSGRLTEDEARARLSGQLSVDDKAARAHAVLTNDGSIDELRAKVCAFWKTTIETELMRRNKR